MANRNSSAPAKKPAAAAAVNPFHSDDEDDGENELEVIKQKTNQTMDETVASSRRMVGLVEETRTSGAKTLSMLDDQGQQLNRLEGKQAKIDGNLDEADRQLSLLERWCCGCCAGRRPPPVTVEIPEFTASGKPNPNRPKADSVNGSVMVDPRGGNLDADGKPKKKGRILKDDQREDELEQNMDIVGDILGDLKQQAYQMNSTIDEQNEQISRISRTTENNLAHVKQVNQRVDKML